MAEPSIAESLLGDYRGIMWDLGAYFFPGSIFGSGLLFLFPGDVNHLIALIGNSWLLLFIFLLVAYAIGLTIDNVRGIVQNRFSKQSFRRRYLEEVLSIPAYREVVNSYVLQGQEDISKADLYYLLTKYVRMKNIDLYNFYVARQIYINDLRSNLGVALLGIGIIAAFLKSGGLTAAGWWIIVGLWGSGLALLYNASKGRRRQIFSIVEAIYICSLSTGPSPC